jgi:hypothetical protein
MARTSPSRFRLALQPPESCHEVGHRGRLIRPVEGPDLLLDDAVRLRDPLVLSHVLEQGLEQERLDEAGGIRRVLKDLPPERPAPQPGLTERLDGVQELARPGRVDPVLHRDEDRASVALQAGRRGHLRPMPGRLEVGPLAAREMKPEARREANKQPCGGRRESRCGPRAVGDESPEDAPRRHPPEEDQQVDGQRLGPDPARGGCLGGGVQPRQGDKPGRPRGYQENAPERVVGQPGDAERGGGQDECAGRQRAVGIQPPRERRQEQDAENRPRAETPQEDAVVPRSQAGVLLDQDGQ